MRRPAKRLCVAFWRDPIAAARGSGESSSAEYVRQCSNKPFWCIDTETGDHCIHGPGRELLTPHQRADYLRIVTLAQCAQSTGSSPLCKILHLAFFGPARFRRMVQNRLKRRTRNPKD